jgi:hypothetical protein
MELSVKDKVEFYYSVFFENIVFTISESEKYKIKISKLLEDELNAYYFDFGRWFVKKDKTSKSLSQLHSELGHMTNRWSIDWAWIFHHIMLDFLNIGFAQYLSKKYGSHVLVYKWVPDKYFKLAEEVYLKDPKTREPILFRLDKLINEGTVLNLKSSKTLPNIGVTLWDDFNNDIWDTTELRKYDETKIWDIETKLFVYNIKDLKKKEIELEKRGIKGKIKVTIGSKIFWV